MKKDKPSYFEKVYEVTQMIPPGRVSTYGAIADFLALGSARMVGWALNKIPFMDDVIPAHRVVNRKGELTGRNHFPTPDLMQKRLEKEDIQVIDNKIVDFEHLFWHPESTENEK